MSDAETESETIDDFLQYSDHINEKVPAKSSIDSRSETPIFKTIPIKISGNYEKIPEKSSHNLLLNEEKDNSEDLMVEISKKTTIKKTISKTTLVNGVTQASEFEKSIIKNTHLNENINHQGNLKLPKSFRDHAYLEFQAAMSDNYVNENIFPKSSGNHDSVSEIIEVTNAPNAFQERRFFNKSPESSESEITKNSKTYKSFQNNDNFERIPKESKRIEMSLTQNVFKENSYKIPESNIFETNENSNAVNKFHEREKENRSPEIIEISKSHNTSHLKKKSNKVPEYNKIFKVQELRNDHKNPEYFLSGNDIVDMTPNAFNEKEFEHKTITDKSGLHNYELNESEKELNSKKSASDFIDNNEEKKKSLLFNSGFKNHSYNNKDYKENDMKDFNKFFWPKDIKKDKKVKDKYSGDHDECRNLKSTSANPKVQFNKTCKSKTNPKSIDKNIRWVDPLKSYHLKYDLKDNGKSMQNWIKQKQEALHRSDPNCRMKNSIRNKSIKYLSSTITNPLPLSSSINKNNTYNDIKEYIIRGNIKENLFQARHPYPQFTKSEYSFQYPSKKDAVDFSKSHEKINLKSISSFNNNVDEIKRKEQTFELVERRNNDLNFQVSKILNKFDVIEQGMKHTPSKVQQQYWNEIKVCHGNCHKTVCCYNSYHNYCTRYGSHSYPFMNDNNFENYKNISYESSAAYPINNRNFSTNYSSKYNNTKSSISDFSSKTLKHRDNQFYTNEPEVCNINIENNRIDYLQTKLNTIENRIRNIKLNHQKSVYECEIDLECQCREIERQLKSLNKVTPNIREAA